MQKYKKLFINLHKKNILNRFLLHISYKGTNFHGWQIQPNAITIQEVIQKALFVLLKEKINLMGAGRTDTGVHAKKYFAHFDTSSKIVEKEKFIKQINGIVGKEIVIHTISKINSDFHSRFSAKSRTYKYYIHTEKNPFIDEFSFLLFKKIDIEKMNKACNILFEYKDFTSFSKLNSGTKTNLCNIYKAKWFRDNEKLIFEIKANRFLRNMVRAIVGTLIDVGIGKISISDFKNIIESKNRSSAGYSVPAKGLFLVDIEY